MRAFLVCQKVKWRLKRTCLESKHLEKVQKGTSLIFYHDNMSCLLGNSFLFTPKIYLKYFFFALWANNMNSVRGWRGKIL